MGKKLQAKQRPSDRTEAEYLKKMIARFSPPEQPLFARDDTGIELALPQMLLWLPESYLLFHRHYGSGDFVAEVGKDRRIGTYMRFFNPFDPWFLQYVMGSCAMFHERRHEQHSFPYRCYPTPGGIVPIGGVSDGESLYILPIGGGDYHIVHDERALNHGPTCFRCITGVGFCEFLYRFLTNRLEDYRYFSVPPRFVPGEWLLSGLTSHS